MTNSYDRIGQLKVADSSDNSEDRGYQYDAAWNLNHRTNNGSAETFGVDGLNQLTNAPFGENAYDANGNLTAGHDGIWDLTQYDYDDENQLVRVTFWGVPDGGTESIPVRYTDFFYDGFNRLRVRVEYSWDTGTNAWVLGAETRHLYDGRRVIQERDGSNTPMVSYTRGSDLAGGLESAGGIGGLLARSDGYDSGNWLLHDFYFADGNGNITALVDGTQSLSASYRYDPFGNTLSQSGDLADANVYRFSSKEVHAYSRLYCFGYRFYSPGFQRWLNRDPLAEESYPRTGL